MARIPHRPTNRRRRIVVSAFAVLFAGLGVAAICRRWEAPRVPAPPAAGLVRRESQPTGFDRPVPTGHLTGTIDQGPDPGEAQTDALPPSSSQSRSAQGPSARGVRFSSIATELPESSNFAETPVARGAIHHRVISGDTLASLAERYLGSPERYGEILQANRLLLTQPDLLPVGMDLVIPVESVAAAENSPDNSDRGGMTPIRNDAWRRGLRESALAKTHRVRANETLVDIAQEFYGDGAKFLDVFQANRDLLSQPSDLREGMLLTLP